MPSKFAPTRQHKRKVLARQAQTQELQRPDTNLEVITTTKSEREEQRQRLRDELRAQQPKISAKKQKRLDKYIENKLRRDENNELIKKLAAEKERSDLRGLQSSKNLNSKKRSFANFVEGQVQRDEQPHATQHHNSDVLRKKNRDRNAYDQDVNSEDSFEEENREAFEPVEEENENTSLSNSADLPTQGSGLAQPLQIGPDGLPVIPTRGKKRQKHETSSSEHTSQQVEILPEGLLSDGRNQSIEDEVWEGFVSDEGATEKPTVQPNSSLKIDEEVLDAILDALENSDLEDSSEEKEDSETSDSDIHHEEQDADRETSFEEENPSDQDLSNDHDSAASSQTSLIFDSDVQIKPRVSAFKSWATQQLNQSIGHVPSYEQPQKGTAEVMGEPTGVKPAAGYRLGINGDAKPDTVRSAYSVQVERTQATQDSRLQLPILQREQEIMEAVNNNLVIVIKGDTGSGKTTQVPQFLFEGGYGDKNGPTPGIIGITQPRRVAAVSMARRVSEELGNHGEKVAYQIRFDTTISSNTAVKFMTDGILLRELSQDLLLKKYSVIVIDEAHERSVNTDLLIGMLSKVVPARMKKSEQNPDPKPLKLIIMSATLNIEDFLHEKLFSPGSRPPVVQAEGRQYKVTTHFALKSRADYIEEVIEKVKRGHRKLPRGGILVFLTGQNEIKHVLSRLKNNLRHSSDSSPGATLPRMHISAVDAPLEMDDFEYGNHQIAHMDDDDNEIDIFTDEAEADKEFEISDEEEPVSTTNSISNYVDKRDPYDTVHILPLYSQLPTKEQLRIFELPPDRSRLIVLATNVAETSLTIPGIRYVFDCGRSKERKYDNVTSVQTFEIDYISKASAQQRAGRAGRTGPGHCWRLYSSAVYERFFPEYLEPEILRTPAENVILQLKSFRYPRPSAEFPFPSAPSKNTLQKAEKLLRNLGAIAGPTGTITELGKKLSIYPISPRLGKTLVNAVEQSSILPEILALISALSIEEIFITEPLANIVPHSREDIGSLSERNHIEFRKRDELKQQYGRVHALFGKQDKSSDALKLLKAVQLYLEASDKDLFCQHHFLRPKAMLEISQLFHQLCRMVQVNHPDISGKNMYFKSKLDATAIKAINTNIASGYIDQIALRYDLHPTPPALLQRPSRSIDVPYLPLSPINTHSSEILDRTVFIHPSSILSRLSINSLPEYIVYRHLQTSQSHTVSGDGEAKTKIRMMPLTTLDAQTLLTLIRNTGLIEYGKPVPKTKVEDVPNTRPKERVCWVSAEVRDREGSGGGLGSGWPLPPSRVRQVMDLKDRTGWRVVEVIA